MGNTGVNAGRGRGKNQDNWDGDGTNKQFLFALSAYMNVIAKTDFMGTNTEIHFCL